MLDRTSLIEPLPKWVHSFAHPPAAVEGFEGPLKRLYSVRELELVLSGPFALCVAGEQREGCGTAAMWKVTLELAS